MMAAALVRSKAVLAIGWSGNFAVTMLIPLITFWLGGVAEAATTPGAGAAEKIKGKATGAAVLGPIGFDLLYQVAFFKFA